MIRRIHVQSRQEAEDAGLLDRSPVPDATIRRRAEEIVEAIRVGGDQALADLGGRLGGGRVPSRVAPSDMRSALEGLEARLRAHLEVAIHNVRTVHAAQQLEPVVVEPTPGVRVERRWTPLARVGAYVPGGKAAYPSTLIMTVVPAQLAGVREIVVASPAATDGTIPSVVLATAALLDIDEFYAMGGAQAVAALAYGTETIARVDKIVGPGNAWVTAAKLAVFGDVSIDLPAGPSEVMVLADRWSDPELVAIDLLCQAEHGPDSPAILITDHDPLLDDVERHIEVLLEQLERRSILRKGLADHARFLTVDDWEVGIDIANAYAPEHASVHTNRPDQLANRLTAVGSVYVGAWSPESAGDYATGANHVLPTGGLGASHGPLSVADFGSWRQIQTLTEGGLTFLQPTISGLAAAEGLSAHALAAELRLERTRKVTGPTP